MKNMLQGTLIVGWLLLLATYSNGQSAAIVSMLDYSRENLSPGSVAKYIEEVTPIGNGGQVKLYSYPNKQLICSFAYSDVQRKIKEGTYIGYHPNGQISDSGYFNNNRKNGWYMQWYANGQLQSKTYYRQDMPADSSVEWHPNGSIKRLWICDENGNGNGEEFYDNGQPFGKGKIRNGQQHQKWNYQRSNGQPLMDVSFFEGDPISATCYNENGATFKENCYFKADPMFPGGNTAWVQYILQQLKYPEAGNGLSGMVKMKFDIDTKGRLCNFDVLATPGEAFSNAVKKLLEESPAWLPAMFINQPIVTSRIQEFYFRPN